MPAGVDEHVRQPAGAAGLSPFLPVVQLPAGLAGAAGHDHRAHVGGLEDPERGLREVPGQVGQLAPEAQVRLVRAEPRHGVGVGHPRDGSGQFVASDLGPQAADQVLGDLDDVLPGDEAHLDVHLGNAAEKFGVAEGLDKLGWYYPGIGEYAGLLEKHGLEVREASLFERPTRLEDGEEGLKTWLRMFRKPVLERLPIDRQIEFLEEIEDEVRPRLFKDGVWELDYRRLRIAAYRL